MCNTSYGKESIENNGVSYEDVSGNCTNAINRVPVDPLKIHHSPMPTGPCASGANFVFTDPIEALKSKRKPNLIMQKVEPLTKWDYQ